MRGREGGREGERKGRREGGRREEVCTYVHIIYVHILTYVYTHACV